MPSVAYNNLKKQLVMLAKDSANRAIFWSFAKRRRALKETSVEAVYIAIQRDFDPKSASRKKVEDELKMLVKSSMLTDDQKELMLNIYDDLISKNISITKDSIIDFFKSLHDLNFGRYIRSYDRNKKRFEWVLLPCIDVGKMTLLSDYEIEFKTEAEKVVDMKDGRVCLIEFPGEKEGKLWMSFLKKIKSWVDYQIYNSD